MDTIRVISCAVLGYLLGSISASVLLTKFAYHRDVRTQGSGNAGATNVARVFGMGAGVFTLLADVLKTVLAMLAGRWIFGDIGLAVAGAACITGHCWPVYFHFRGGKGVAVGAAIGLMLDWRLLLILLAAFFLTFAICRIVSVCSMVCAVVLPVAAALMHLGTSQLVLSIFAGVLVLFMHRSNFMRLLRGEEKKFKPGKKSKQDHQPGA